jgi:hypothetical protein
VFMGVWFELATRDLCPPGRGELLSRYAERNVRNKVITLAIAGASMPIAFALGAGLVFSLGVLLGPLLGLGSAILFLGALLWGLARVRLVGRAKHLVDRAVPFAGVALLLGAAVGAVAVIGLAGLSDLS